MAIEGATIQVPRDVVTTMQLIWRSDALDEILQLQKSYSNLT